jgi:peptidoglycan/xylan/chitin deacetylase (PgdA/CDA1 family)
MVSRKRLKISAVILALILVTGGTVVFQSDRIVAAIAKWSPEVVYFVETEEPVVALTIDDGPDPATTPEILDVLDQYDAHATFFLISSHVPGNEDIVVRTVEEGHEIANHLTTDEPSILLPFADFEQQLLEAHDVLSQFADVHWFRPGSGWYNAGMLSIAHEHGYRCALGSVHPFDPQIPSAWFAAHYILGNIQPGSIIILHDYGARGERTVTALETVLPELDRRGFRVVTLSELVDLTQ